MSRGSESVTVTNAAKGGQGRQLTRPPLALVRRHTAMASHGICSRLSLAVRRHCRVGTWHADMPSFVSLKVSVGFACGLETSGEQGPCDVRSLHQHFNL